MAKSASSKSSLFCLFALLMASLLFCCTTADQKIKQVTDPTGNVNLSPFEQWISAEECLKNTSTICPANYQLNETGRLNLTRADMQDYCKAGGCAEHTMGVLLCIHHVKQDYKFINKATVQDINYTITHGCSSGFTGTTLFLSDAKRTSNIGIALLFSIFAALF